MPGSVRRVTAMGLGIVSRSQVLTKGLPFATWSSGIILVLGARCQRLISKSCPVPFVPATLVGVVLGGGWGKGGLQFGLQCLPWHPSRTWFQSPRLMFHWRVLKGQSARWSLRGFEKRLMDSEPRVQVCPPRAGDRWAASLERRGCGGARH